VHRKNPGIEIPNPYEELQGNIDKMAQENPEMLEESKLCYEVFERNEYGKKLLKIYEDRFLFASLVNPFSVNVNESSMYWVGFTDVIKGFKRQIADHKMRINEVCQKKQIPDQKQDKK